MVTSALAHILAVLVLPLLLTGVIQRVKAWWSGRRGAPLLQPTFDLLRLLRKTPVYSETTTPVFRLAPWVLLTTSLGSAVFAPLLGPAALCSFHLDFVWFAYAWGLGRAAMMLAALDTGSSFEGMGAAREATFSTFLEPVFFLTAGALSLATGKTKLAELMALHPQVMDGTGAVWLLSLAALVVVLLVEAGRMPVDDPTTHLELTMVHEVMVLDHSGPDLALIQWASALKLYVGFSLLAALLNPWFDAKGPESAAAQIGLCVVLALTLGTLESLIARLRLRAVPKFIALGLAAAALALLATAWKTQGAP
jgi:formate hydrogenlyase subunit 4